VALEEITRTILANIIHPLNEFRQAYPDNEEILLLLEIMQQSNVGSADEELLYMYCVLYYS